MENRNAIAYGFIGGLFLILADGVGGIPFWLWIPLVLGIIVLPGIAPILWVVLIGLELLAVFGGFTIWAGVYLIWRQRLGTAKFLIGVGTGFGLTSLIVTTIIAVLFPTIGFFLFLVVFSFLELLGIIFSILARRQIQDIPKTAKKAS